MGQEEISAEVVDDVVRPDGDVSDERWGSSSSDSSDESRRWNSSEERWWEDDHLDWYEILGIVIGSVIAVCLVILVIWVCCCRKKNKQSPPVTLATVTTDTQTKNVYGNPAVISGHPPMYSEEKGDVKSFPPYFTAPPPLPPLRPDMAPPAYSPVYMDPTSSSIYDNNSTTTPVTGPDSSTYDNNTTTGLKVAPATYDNRAENVYDVAEPANHVTNPTYDNKMAAASGKEGAEYLDMSNSTEPTKF